MPYRLLIVEESKVIRAFLRELVKPMGYLVAEAQTLEEVNTVLETCGCDIAVIAMDLFNDEETIIDLVTKRGIPTILLKDDDSALDKKQMGNSKIIDYVDKKHQEDFRQIVDLIQRIEKNPNRKVLVVDDSKIFQHHISGLLKLHRFDVLVASDGVEALQVLSEHPELEMIITDYEMPNKNGLELIRDARRKYSVQALPIIVISSLETKEMVVDALRSGANDYLHKPFEKDEFFTRIYKTLDSKDNLDAIKEQTRLLNQYKERIDKYTIVSITDVHGIITDISQAYEKVSGYTKQEVIGRTHSVFRHPDTSEEFYAGMWDNLLAGKAWEGEVENRRKDGEAYWLKLYIEPQTDRNGDVQGYIATGHDITNKVQLEVLTKELEYRVMQEVEKNRLQAAQLIDQSRLAQMGEMISMIAHQWRQPLASVSAIASTLTLDVIMDNYEKEFFEERLGAIADLAQHLSATIDDFRGFFKQNKEVSSATWETIAEGSLGIIEPTLKTRNIVVHRRYEANEPFSTYINEVRQVILNILKNAEDIFLEKKIEEPTIWIRSYEKDSTVCISIEDNAGGIPSEVIGKVFDPYFSTKTEIDGTGLGLYMSKKIIEEHCRGKLKASNTSNGALFEIVLPKEQKHDEHA